MRPTLSASLLEILNGLLPLDTAIRVTGLALDLPLEVAFTVLPDGAPVILAGPPRWRWTTDFDSRPGRIRVALAAGRQP
jgi:hypothetical protein